MATKEELAEDIEEVLGTGIEWERLRKEDLEHLMMMVEDGALAEPLLKQMAKKHGKKKVDEQIEEWYPGKYAGTLL